jgi:hypothetical protein
MAKQLVNIPGVNQFHAMFLERNYNSGENEFFHVSLDEMKLSEDYDEEIIDYAKNLSIGESIDIKEFGISLIRFE